jgi:plastocyanin
MIWNGRIGAGRVAVGTLAAGVLLLGACGDDDSDDDAGAASTSIEVEATEFEFDPDAWTVPVGEEFTVEFENVGEIDHEWAVLKLGEDIESEAEFEEDKVEFEIEATPAGESVTEQFTLDEAGTYQVVCALPGHFDAGMEGTLEVE